jgi:hypothetical protein
MTSVAILWEMAHRARDVVFCMPNSLLKIVWRICLMQELLSHRNLETRTQ